MKRVLGISILVLAIFALFAACKSPVEVEITVKDVYTVTFDKNGGDTEASPRTITVTTPATTVRALPTAPTRAGYDFASWNTKTDGTGDAFTAATTVTANITVYAQWTEVLPGSFTVTFNKNHEDAADFTEAIPASKVVAPPATTIDSLPTAPTRKDNTFASWNTQANGSGDAFTASTTVTASITVYAQWTPVGGDSYTIVIDKVDDVTGDDVTASPASGEAGDTITINYDLASDKINNRLVFSGTTAAIAEVNTAGEGTRTYTIDADDANNEGVITITATFTHSDKTLDTIAFEDSENVSKTYGDAAFTRAVTNSGAGSGAITYTSSDPTVATVVSTTGEVAIVKAGSTTITATKAEDATYAGTTASYNLTVEKLLLTIGTPAGTTTKTYDGTATASGITAGSLTNKVGSDDVTAVVESAVYNSANVAEATTITVAYTISGTDAGNYTKPIDSEISGTITKADGATVAAPTLAGKTDDSITINAVTAPGNGQAVEYGIDIARDSDPLEPPDDSWQTELTFSELESETEYYVFARAKADDNHEAGAATKSATSFTTDKAKDPGATLSGSVTVYRLRDTSVRINTVTAPTNGQTVEFAVSTDSTAPSSGWQDGREFTGLSANTAYYAYARAKENGDNKEGTAISSVTFTAKAVPTTTVPPLVVDFETSVTVGSVKGAGTAPTVTVVSDPATVGENSLQVTLNGGNNNWGAGASVNINLPTAMSNYKSFSFRLYVPNASAALNGNAIKVYIAPLSANFEQQVIDNNNGANWLVGTANSSSDYTKRDQWMDYEFDISSLGSQVPTSGGNVKLAIGMNTQNNTTYLLDDLTFTVKDGIDLNSSISPTTATFVKAQASALYKDIPITMTLWGNMLTGISGGSPSITTNNYTVNGDVVTLKKEYLASQLTSPLTLTSVTLTFEFNKGDDSNIVIKIGATDEDLMITSYDFTTNPGTVWIYSSSTDVNAEWKETTSGGVAPPTGGGVSNGVLEVQLKTRSSGNLSGVLALPFNLGSTTLGDYQSVKIEMAPINGSGGYIDGGTNDASNKNFALEVSSNPDRETFGLASSNTRIIANTGTGGSLGTYTAHNINLLATLSEETKALSGEVYIGFGIPAYFNPTIVYHIKRITLVPK